MAIDTAPTDTLTLTLSDELADTPGSGVERVVDRETLEEAEAILESDLGDEPDVDVWVLRDGTQAVSALVAARDADGVTITGFATAPEHRRAGRGERLLRAVLGHYALEGTPVASLATTHECDGLCRRIGFS